MKTIKFALAIISCITLSSCREPNGVYEVDCKTAPSNWRSLDDFIRTQQDSGAIIDYIVNSIKLDRAGRLNWNGSMIRRKQLSEYLTQLDKLDPRPLVELRIENGTACMHVEDIRQIMVRSKICQNSGKYCTEELSDYEGPPPPPEDQIDAVEKDPSS